MDVVVESLGPETRAGCLAVEVLAEQRAFVRDVAAYVAGCERDQVWSPFAIRADGEVVGFVMTAFDEGEGHMWIGGLQVDARHQRRTAPAAPRARRCRGARRSR